MVIGAAMVELHVHGSQSLKAKRGVVRSISQRLRNRFNVSVAEVGGQDTWQRATLGLSTTGADGGRVRNVLERAVDFVEELHLAEVLVSDIQIVEFGLEDGFDPWADDDVDAGEDDDRGEG